MWVNIHPRKVRICSIWVAFKWEGQHYSIVYRTCTSSCVLCSLRDLVMIHLLLIKIILQDCSSFEGDKCCGKQVIGVFDFKRKYYMCFKSKNEGKDDIKLKKGMKANPLSLCGLKDI